MARRALTLLLCLWVGLGVSVAPYRPARADALGAAGAHAARHARHPAPAKESAPTGTHHHDLRCALCVVGTGALPDVVRAARMEGRTRIAVPGPVRNVRAPSLSPL